ncbi:MurR/RpiR family transcriptional regulator [Affinibrenneria salicis]|uniref:MurR/RpiR family transcriptional regulator n=1 Tax=Affinibrenneria salicis TaxID=2590031 RepID=A0A5J5G6L4_9GAMM|nr:MurR/RpiR family transcriptional regulator [Affinibrenneria salicis]KAA9002819.1 MurR/RpiR family transcriptional regulator [Affinibrenneria salicis]KAA9002894.1 MurR/RpiR family transcriptional regulator [Affinibrenneria salicis]
MMNSLSPIAEEKNAMLAELQTIIRRVYSALSPAEKKLVDVILAHQHHLASYSATELAGLAGVSKSTAARVFRRLGFEDFNQFRTKCRGIEPVGGSPLSNLEQHPQRPKTLRERLEVHVERERENLSVMHRNSMPAELERAVNLLSGARRVWVIGFRNSYATAFYAQALFSHALSDVQLVNDPAAKFADVLADIQPQDVLFVVDFPRQIRLLSYLVQVAKTYRARVIILSNSLVSDIDALADIVIPCAASGSAIFDSYTAAISMVNFLGNELVAKSPEKASQRMQRMEDIHQQIDDLYQPVPLPHEDTSNRF